MAYTNNCEEVCENLCVSLQRHANAMVVAVSLSYSLGNEIRWQTQLMEHAKYVWKNCQHAETRTHLVEVVDYDTDEEVHDQI